MLLMMRVLVSLGVLVMMLLVVAMRVLLRRPESQLDRVR